MQYYSLVNFGSKTLLYNFRAPLPPPSLSVIADEATASSVKLQWLYTDNTEQSLGDLQGTMADQLHDDTGSVQHYLVPSLDSGSIVEHIVDGLTAGYHMSVRAGGAGDVLI